MRLNNKIKTLRLSKNLTQIYMAEELGIDAANYSRLERGETKICTDRLAKIAKILDVQLNELLIEKENTTEIIDSISVTLLQEILNEIRIMNQKIM